MLQRAIQTRGFSNAGLGALLALLVALAFAPSLDNGFVDYDDDLYITRNPHVAGGLTPANVAWAFTSFYGANWFPLTQLSWMFDVSLFGLDPRAFHATSLALHAAAAWLLFAALFRLTGSRAVAWFAAALFALHPLRVESVAWASYRRDVLAGVCFAGALYSYAGTALRANRERLALRAQIGVAIWLVLGLLAKPTLVTLPLVLLLLDFWPLGRLRAEAGSAFAPARLAQCAREKWPLFALVALHAAVSVAAQSSAGAVQSLDQIPLAQRVSNALVSLFAYLEQTAWPAGLAAFYPHPGPALPGWQVAAAAIGLAGLTALAITSARRAPQLAVGWLWYLVTLAPVIGLVQVGAQARADRYTYLPQIGIWLALAVSAKQLARTKPWLARVALGSGVALIAAFGVRTAEQCRVWRDTTTLFEHALAVTANNHIAHINLAEEAVAQRRPGAARSHAQQALALAKQSAYAQAALGEAESLAGNPAQAEVAFRRALERDPENALWRARLGDALRAEGRHAEAVAEYERALVAAPLRAELHANHGLALRDLGRSAAALAAFERAIEIDPALGPAHGYRAVALEERGEIEAALASYHRAVELAPSEAALRARYARLLGSRGEFAAALAQLDASLEVEPREAGVHALYAALALRAGREADSVLHARRALALGERAPALLNDLAWTLAAGADPALRAPAEALALAREAVAARRDPRFLDTLAAAHAALGESAAAIAALREAVALAREQGDAALADELSATLARREAESSSTPR